MPSKKFEETWSKFKSTSVRPHKNYARDIYEAGYEEALEEIRPQIREMAKILQGEVRSFW